MADYYKASQKNKIIIGDHELPLKINNIFFNYVLLQST